ncbi:hypothetical protein PAPHI01_1371 [Pancytospora philotis]|nr:hypothetical protein PAPHI01_1371 [Pancytospora philotis]
MMLTQMLDRVDKLISAYDNWFKRAAEDAYIFFCDFFKAVRSKPRRSSSVDSKHFVKVYTDKCMEKYLRADAEKLIKIFTAFCTDVLRYISSDCEELFDRCRHKSWTERYAQADWTKRDILKNDSPSYEWFDRFNGSTITNLKMLQTKVDALFMRAAQAEPTSQSSLDEDMSAVREGLDAWVSIYSECMRTFAMLYADLYELYPRRTLAEERCRKIVERVVSQSAATETAVLSDEDYMAMCIIELFQDDCFNRMSELEEMKENIFVIAERWLGDSDTSSED